MEGIGVNIDQAYDQFQVNLADGAQNSSTNAGKGIYLDMLRTDRFKVVLLYVC